MKLGRKTASQCKRNQFCFFEYADDWKTEAIINPLFSFGECMAHSPENALRFEHKKFFIENIIYGFPLLDIGGEMLYDYIS